MKRLLLLSIILTISFSACNKNNEDEELVTKYPEKPLYDENKTFLQSEFTGVWEVIEKHQFDWIKNDCEKGKEYYIFYENGNFEYFDACNILSSLGYKGSYIFDQKNKITVNQSFYFDNYKEWKTEQVPLYLINNSKDELIFSIYEKSGQIRKLKRTSLSIDDYYQRTTLGFILKDTTNFNLLWWQDKQDKSYLIGTKNEKLWIGTFDTKTKEQLSEVIDTEKFNLDVKTHIGHGQYQEDKIARIIIDTIHPDNEVYIYSNYLKNNYDHFKSIWFTQSSLKYNIIYNQKPIPWYNNSILIQLDDIDKGKWTCLSEKGEVIFSGYANTMRYWSEGLKYQKNLHPIDYKKFIFFEEYTDGISVFRTSINEKNESTSKEISTFKINKGNNYLFNAKVLNKNNNIWTFKIDITEYSGEKHSHTIDIDINEASI